MTSKAKYFFVTTTNMVILQCRSRRAQQEPSAHGVEWLGAAYRVFLCAPYKKCLPTEAVGSWRRAMCTLYKRERPHSTKSKLRRRCGKPGEFLDDIVGISKINEIDSQLQHSFRKEFDDRKEYKRGCKVLHDRQHNEG